MALIPCPDPSAPQIHKLPQYTYIDALRWLPHLSTFTRHILLATYDADTSTPSLQTFAFSPSENAPSLTPQASATASSRIASLKISPSPLTPSKPLVAAATFSGTVLFYSADLINGSLDCEFSVPEKGFHSGAVSGIDLNENGSECVSVGEDGRVNLVNLSSKGGFKRVFDSNGLVSYSAVKWASPVEFVTGAFGFGLHWWDQRKSGGPVATFNNNWTRGSASGIVHSIDIHPSRKHTCLAGGSSGVVFAWDTRWPKQPVLLSGVGFSDTNANSIVESDVWEVQYDNYTHSSKIVNSSSSSSRILPAMICSEDGILAVIEQGEEPIELLAEPCAINSFDIDRQNPSDVICSLEWESIAILTRP
ncbi:Nuclear pore complex protein NUP43 [Striga hermonthica]|uniref:Nuclear pore complex protein NUP43 n=1 Tax=Striga hermonthica TaxID=68872 RepID=A0A9N7MTG4_STRHE|nr:Nuclear pore complex protein NUP43 [Striga hermonthica]